MDCNTSRGCSIRVVVVGCAGLNARFRLPFFFALHFHKKRLRHSTTHGSNVLVAQVSIASPSVYIQRQSIHHSTLIHTLKVALDICPTNMPLIFTFHQRDALHRSRLL